MPALAPCPFCGGYVSASRVPGQGVSLLCNGCGAIAMLGQNSTRQALEAAWNRRDVRYNFSQSGSYKPCPFCASHISLGKLQGNSSILQCSNCGMLVSFVGSTDLNTTIRQWNRRM